MTSEQPPAGEHLPAGEPPPAWHPPAQEHAQAPPPAGAFARGVAARIPLPGWLLLGGFLVAIIASFLPFYNVGVEGIISIGVPMSGLDKVLVFVFVAAGVACLVPLINGSGLDSRRLIGVTVAVALLIALFVLVLVVNNNPEEVKDYPNIQVTWAFGLYLFLVALIAMVAGLVMLWMKRGKAQGPAR